MLSLTFLINEFDPFAIYREAPVRLFAQLSFQNLIDQTHLARPCHIQLGQLTLIQSVLKPHHPRPVLASSSDGYGRIRFDGPI
jgi:hypothetical protein